MSGYLLLVLLVATTISAVYTDFNKNVLHIPLWSIIVPVALIILGVYPRLHPRKLGFKFGGRRD